MPNAVRLAVITLSIAATAAPAAAETNRLFAAALDSITADELYEHVEVLADDVYEGRAAGSRGGHAAARYLIKELQQGGLTPAGTGGEYTQPFGNDCRNILVIQPGYDPELQNETIVVGAHYDHVGYGTSSNSFGPIGKIHNGADDNASGTAVLLETIEAFAISGLRTRRSVLFAFWDGEEGGLLGSRHWLAHPTTLHRVRLAITVDMVGRLRDGRLYVLGTRSGYGLRRLMSGMVGDPLWLDYTWELHENSDHWSFLEHRIPTTLLHTGLHGDYHRPSDDADKINRQGMRDASRYMLAAIAKIGNEDRLPTFRGRATGETQAMRRSLEKPLERRSLNEWPAHEPPPRLGISWREDEAEPGAVFVTRVVEGTPAAAAGLAVHDRIYELDNRPFAHAAEFHARILAALDADPPALSFLTERRGHTREVTVAMPSASQELRAESHEPAPSGS